MSDQIKKRIFSYTYDGKLYFDTLYYEFDIRNKTNNFCNLRKVFHSKK